MIARRDLLIGALCAVGAGGAYALKPTRRVSLLGNAKLGDLVPGVVGDWSARDVSDLVAPQTEDSLMSKLYGQTVERIYTEASTGAEVMVLLAYGDSQTNELQLHRPEVCYPSFGFEISDNEATLIPISGGVTVPGRRLVAQAADRVENIVYWARIGEFLPIICSEQRVDRLKTAISGYIADGLSGALLYLGQ